MTKWQNKSRKLTSWNPLNCVAGSDQAQPAGLFDQWTTLVWSDYHVISSRERCNYSYSLWKIHNRQHWRHSCAENVADIDNLILKTCMLVLEFMAVAWIMPQACLELMQSLYLNWNIIFSIIRWHKFYDMERISVCYFACSVNTLFYFLFYLFIYHFINSLFHMSHWHPLIYLSLAWICIFTFFFFFFRLLFICWPVRAE